MIPSRPFCARLQSRFNDFRDGEVSPFFAAVLRHHLSECASCREDYHVMERVIESFRRVPAPDVPPRLLRKVVRNLSGPPGGTPSPAMLFDARLQPGLDAL